MKAQTLRCAARGRALTLLLITCLLVISTNLTADEIHLKNGRVIKGEIITEDDQQVQIKVGNRRYTIARSDIEKIVKTTAEGIILTRAQNLRIGGELFKAYDQYCEYLRVVPDDIQAQAEQDVLVMEMKASLNQRFQAARQRGDYTQIIASMDELISDDLPLPPSQHFLIEHRAQYYLLRAKQYYDNYKFNPARDDLEKALAADIENLEACLLLARIYYDNLNNPQQAEPLFAKVCRTPGATLEQQMMLFRCQIRLQHYSAALNLYRGLKAQETNSAKLAQFHQRFRPTMLRQAKNLERMGLQQDAAEWFEVWYASFPVPSVPVLAEAVSFYQRNRMSEELRATAALLRDYQNLVKLKRALGDQGQANGGLEQINLEEATSDNTFVVVDNPARARAMARESKRLILAFFYHRTSAQARHFKDTHLRDGACQAAIGRDFIVLFVDMDETRGAAFSRMFNIRQAPGFLVLDAVNAPITKPKYLANPSEFLVQLRQHPSITAILQRIRR